jgi:putative ABC transport system permease protein
MLRCLGLTQTQATTVFALEFLMLAIAGSVAGVLLGYAGHLALISWLGDLLTTDLPPASVATAGKGLLTGVVLLAGFAMPQVLRLRKVPHTMVRRQLDGGRQWLWGAYLTGLLAMLGLMIWHTGQVKMSILLAVVFGCGRCLHWLEGDYCPCWACCATVCHFRAGVLP